MKSQRPVVNIRLVALLTALVPLLAVHATYLVAASYGHVEWCNPYIDSCTSISATARKPPSSFLFRATMLPCATLMMFYWWLNYSWLDSLSKRSGAPVRQSNKWMLVLGVLACVGLILYITVLGERGDVWSRQRRIGTILFFSFTYVAQLLFLRQLFQLKNQLPQVPHSLLLAMLIVCLSLLTLGLLTLLFDAWNEAWYDSIEDAFEWVLSLLLQSNFLLSYFVWRYADWSLEVRTK